MPATTPDDVTSFGVNGKGTTLYPAMLEHARDGSSACAMSGPITAMNQAIAIILRTPMDLLRKSLVGRDVRVASLELGR